MTFGIEETQIYANNTTPDTDGGIYIYDYPGFRLQVNDFCLTGLCLDYMIGVFRAVF